MQYARADLPERLKRLPLEPTDVVASAPALAPEFSLQEHDHHYALIMSCPYHVLIMSLSCPYHIMSLSCPYRIMPLSCPYHDCDDR